MSLYEDDPAARKEGGARQVKFALPDRDPKFVAGFACGRMWALMCNGSARIDTFVPASVRDTVEAMAMALGWVEHITVVDANWIRVTMENPHR